MGSLTLTSSFSELPGAIPMIFCAKKSPLPLVYEYYFLGVNADVDFCQKTRHKSELRRKIKYVF